VRALTEGAERPVGFEQVVDARLGRATEVLAPERQARLACQRGSVVAESCGIRGARSSSVSSRTAQDSSESWVHEHLFMLSGPITNQT
jgi:hypothetical protein